MHKLSIVTLSFVILLSSFFRAGHVSFSRFIDINFHAFIMFVGNVSLYVGSGSLMLLSLYFMLFYKNKHYSVLNFLFFLFEFVVSFRSYFDSGDIVQLTLSITLHLCFFICIGMGLYSFLINNKSKDKFHVFYIISLCSIIFVILNLFQMYTDYNAVVWNGRLFGITSHPNTMAMICSLLSLIIISLIIKQYYIHRFERILIYSSLLFLLYFLIQAGSRTGLLSFFIGLIILLRSYVNKKMIFVIFVIIVIFLVSDTYNSDLSGYRIISTENTRSRAWGILINEFLSSIFFGVGDQVSKSENSYLWVLSYSGIFGFLFFITPLLLFVRNVRLAYLYRYKKKANKNIIELITSLSVSILVASFLEGILTESFTIQFLLFNILMAYSNFFYKTINQYDK